MRIVTSALLLLVSVVASTTGAYSLGLREAPPGSATAVTSMTALAAAGWQDEVLGDIDPAVFALALKATACGVRSGDLASPPTLTVIDYSRPSTAQRLWVFDLRAHELLYKELVAHGQGSGENVATRFSNDNDSHQSSLGLFVTENTYLGKNGYSLRLKGLDAGFNDHAAARAIVMHGAPYVSAEFAKQQGRIGRSWGCPALRSTISREVIDRVKGGGAVFAYSNSRDWLRASKYLTDNCGVAAPSAPVRAG